MGNIFLVRMPCLSFSRYLLQYLQLRPRAKFIALKCSILDEFVEEIEIDTYLDVDQDRPKLGVSAVDLFIERVNTLRKAGNHL